MKSKFRARFWPIFYFELNEKRSRLRLITTVVHYVLSKEVNGNVGIFLEKTRETQSKQVKQTGQLAAAAAAGLHEHDAVVCSPLLRRRRGRRKRKKKW